VLKIGKSLLNEADDGNRRFILVQMPASTPQDSEARKAGYNTIAEITKERVRRVIKKLDTEKDSSSDRDRGFRVYKLAPTGFKKWQDYSGTSLEEYEKQLYLHLAQSDIDAKEEDLVTEVALREGFPLDSTMDRLVDNSLVVFRITSEASTHRLFVCLDSSFGRNFTFRYFERLGIAEADVLVCRDEALTDEAKLRIRELCRLATV
jgi:adenine-specific DNA-methyltransferase